MNANLKKQQINSKILKYVKGFLIPSYSYIHEITLSSPNKLHQSHISDKLYVA